MTGLRSLTHETMKKGLRSLALDLFLTRADVQFVWHPTRIRFHPPSSLQLDRQQLGREKAAQIVLSHQWRILYVFQIIDEFAEGIKGEPCPLSLTTTLTKFGGSSSENFADWFSGFRGLVTAARMSACDQLTLFHGATL
jgi:hypothetical protein